MRLLGQDDAIEVSQIDMGMKITLFTFSMLCYIVLYAIYFNILGVLLGIPFKLNTLTPLPHFCPSETIGCPFQPFLSFGVFTPDTYISILHMFNKTKQHFFKTFWKLG